MSTESLDLGTVGCWTRRHLLGLDELSADEIMLVLDKAEIFRKALDAGQRRFPLLGGKTCVNLFFEDSTRTRTSFTLMRAWLLAFLRSWMSWARSSME